MSLPLVAVSSAAVLRFQTPLRFEGARVTFGRVQRESRVRECPDGRNFERWRAESTESMEP